MKLIVMLASFCSVTAFACPQFAGKWHYEDDDGFINLTIDQKDCTSMVETYDQGWGFTVKHPHVFDGQKRLVEDDGDLQVYETARIDNSGASIVEERHSTDEEGKPVLDIIDINMTMRDAQHLAIQRDLVNPDGTHSPMDSTIYDQQK